MSSFFVKSKSKSIKPFIYLKVNMHLWLCLLVVRVVHLSSRKASVEDYRGCWFRMIFAALFSSTFSEFINTELFLSPQIVSP